MSEKTEQISRIWKTGVAGGGGNLTTMAIKFRVCKGVERLTQGLCIAVDTDST
jgi:hypothetical protein